MKLSAQTKRINNLGFSIVEIIMVIAVAGVIILVLANLPGSINLIGKSNHESIAKDVSQQTMENFRSKTYANLGNGSNPITDSRLSKLPGGTGTVVVEDCPETICTNDELVKKITITVSWNEKQEPRSVILTTLISEGGLN